MAEIAQLTFKCPRCACSVCEEILVHVTQSTAFSRVNCEDEIIEIDYQNTSTEGGEIDHYQCQQCGWLLKDEQERTITTAEGLRNWLSRHKPTA